MKSTIEDEKLRTKIERPKGKPLWTSAMRSLHGWTLTKPLKRMNIKTNKRRLKAFATQSLPSFTRQQEVPQVVCPEVCPQVLEVCQVQVHPQVQDPDLLSKRSTNICSLLDNKPPPTGTGSQQIFLRKTG